jgi:hypothetical protein
MLKLSPNLFLILFSGIPPNYYNKTEEMKDFLGHNQTVIRVFYRILIFRPE